jgi:cyclopropane-fatty-acyl-phospholipid synthase
VADVLRRRAGQLPLRLRLWNGQAVSLSSAPPVATVTIPRRRTLLSLAQNAEMTFGDLFAEGHVDVHGDLVSGLEAIYRAWPPQSRPKRGVLSALLGNTLRRARANVHHHYDIGNDFYRLWLDDALVYTCAYFEDPDQTLEQAQRAKMDLVCRKLRLAPGDRVVEAGCGWGALALHMARQYGVTVRAFNISREQIRFARDRAAREGIAGRVEFVEDDYRNISGRYDAFVSVGMLEHVGLPYYAAFGRVIDRVIDPGHGRGLLHFIGRNRPRPLSQWIRARIFPGGYPPTLCEVFERVLEPWNLSVVDVENLRLHYAETLRHWLQRFDTNEDRITNMFDPWFVRAWRLYLAGSRAAFITGTMQLFQVTFVRGGSNEIPWTRAEIATRPLRNGG